MKKRLLCVGLVLAMTASLIACGGKENDGNDGKENNGGASTVTKIEKYDPPITITSFRQDTNSATADYKEGESVENNVWTQLFEEKYGIKLEYTGLAANGSDFNTKVSFMLSSKDIPDYLQINSRQNLQDMVDAGLIQPMDEIYETYASELTKKVMAEADDAVWKSCTFDGKLYAIPWTSAPRENVNLLYIRQDWLDNLGLKAPETMQDVLDICVAFATQDPDKDGKDDTYALAMYKTPTGACGPIFNANGYYDGNWIINDEGYLTNGMVDDGYKETLELLSDWIKKGYIHSEWFTYDANKAKEMVINGEVGVYFGGYSAPITPLSSQHVNEPDSDWMVMVCPDWEGNPVKTYCGVGTSGYWVVSKDCENPEAVMMMLNEFIEVFYYSTDDAEYYKYVNAENGASIWQNAHVRAYRGLKNVDVAAHMADYYAGKMTKEELTCEERATVKQIDDYRAGDESMWKWNKVFGENGACAALAEAVEADAYHYCITYGLPTATEVTNSTILSDFASEWRVGLLNGTKSFDDWDDYVKNYKSMGYDTIRKEIIEKYDVDTK